MLLSADEPTALTGRKRRQVRTVVVQSVGRPEAVSSLARLLLARRQRPPVELVPDEQPRDVECQSQET